MFEKLDKTFKLISGTSLALIFIVMLAQVIMRYVFQSVPFFVEELARYLCIWGVLAGVASCVFNNDHLRMDLILQVSHRLIRKLLEWFLELISLVTYLVLTVYGIKFVLFMYVEKSISMGLPLAYPSAAIPIFFAAASIHSIVQICRKSLPQ